MNPAIVFLKRNKKLKMCNHLKLNKQILKFRAFILVRREGTLVSGSLCNYKIANSTHLINGTLENPLKSIYYWNLDGPVNCTKTFIPQRHQGIILTVCTLNITTISAKKIFPKRVFF